MPDRYGDRDGDDWPPRRIASTVGDYEPTADQLAAFTVTARRALAIGCRYCHAQPGEPCHNAATDQPARKFIAHTIRVIDTQTRVPPPTPPTDDEELF